MRIQLKRGTTAQLATYTPVEGELVVADIDSASPSLVVGDGSTAGGKIVNIPLASLNYFGSIAVTGSNTITAAGASEALTYTGDGLSISANDSTNTVTFTNAYKSFFGLTDVDITSGTEANDMVLISGDGSQITSASFTEKASAFMAAILTVDGAGSTLDADSVDGIHAAAFMTNDTVTTKGDLLVATASSTPARLGVSGDNDKILISDSTTNTGMKWGTVPMNFTWSEKNTATFDAVAGEGYIVDSTQQAVTVVLPASPTFGQQIKIMDGAGTASTSNIIINPNGNNIQGSAANVTLSYDKATVTYTYYNSTRGWLQDLSGIL